jgi:hypothetical protein
MLKQINQEMDKRKLIPLAAICEGDMRLGLMNTDYYAKCMIALAQKLGFGIFGITSESLAEATAKLETNEVNQ